MTEPTLNLGNGKWAIKESGILSYTNFDGFNNVDNYVADECIFTRATTSTLINSQGFIEDSCYNLIGRSEDIAHTDWAKTEMVVTNNFGISPTGLNDASKIVPSINAVSHYIFNQIIYQKNGINNNISFYAKSSGYDFIMFGSSAGNICFNLNDGTIFSNGLGTANVERLPNGWNRCSFNYIPVNETFYFSCAPSGQTSAFYNGAGNGTSGVLLWGVQLTQGSTIRPYLKTTNRLNVPKIDFSANFRKNLLNYSEEIEKYWGPNDVSYVINSIGNPIDGALTADKVIENTNNAYHRLISSTTIVVNNLITYSVYIKPNGRNNIWIYVNDSVLGVNVYARFNLLTGTALGTNLCTSTILSLPDSWFRVSLTYSAASILNLYIDCNQGGQYVGDGTSGIYVYGAQVETGSTVTKYQKTLTVPITNGSFLVEPQRTNNALWSDDFTNATWTTSNLTITPNSIISPNGTQTADLLTATNTSSTSTRTGLIAYPNGMYTASAYFKKGTALKGTIGLTNLNTTQIGYVFDLTDLSTIILSPTNIDFSSISSSIKDVGNGWIRASITANKLTETYLAIVVGMAAPAINDTMYIWGAQFEAGINPTSYISTTNTSVTRNRDAAFIDMLGKGLYSPNNFTMYIEGYWTIGGGGTSAIGISETNPIAFNNNIFFYQTGFGYIIGGSQSIVGFPSSIINSNFKLIIQRNDTQVKFFKDGIQVGATATIPVFDYRYITMQPDAPYYLKDLRLYNTTLTDAECIALTT